MNQHRRSMLQALAVSPFAGNVTLTEAQAFAGRAVRMVVPYAPGGGPDLLTRMLQLRLSAALQQTVFVENKVGAGGIIAAEYTAQQPADGYTMLLASSTHLTQKLLQPKVAFDPVKGFSHVTQVSTAPSLLVVSAASPYRTLDDLIRAAHAAPGKLFYGSGGIGSAAQLSGAALAHFTRMELTHVPYRGSVDLAGALASGDIQFAIPTASTVLPLVGAGVGKLRALAITSASREESLPQVPTLKELTGRDDLILMAWSGIWLPAGAPQAVVSKVFDAYHKVMTDSEVVQAHAKLGVAVTLSATPAAFSSFVAAELAKFQRIIDATGMSIK